MKAQIHNFRRGRHHTSGNQMIVQPEGIDSREKAEKLIGKVVVWENEQKTQIKGKVTGLHGSKGAVRVQFERGMPGQSLSSHVVIE